MHIINQCGRGAS